MHHGREPVQGPAHELRGLVDGLQQHRQPRRHRPRDIEVHGHLPRLLQRVMLRLAVPEQGRRTHQPLQLRTPIAALRQRRQRRYRDRLGQPRSVVGAVRRACEQRADRLPRRSMLAERVLHPLERAAVIGAAAPLHHRPARDDALDLAMQVRVGVQRIARRRPFPVVAEQPVPVHSQIDGDAVEQREELGRGRTLVVVEPTVHIAQAPRGVAGLVGPAGRRSDQAPRPFSSGRG